MKKLLIRFIKFFYTQHTLNFEFKAVIPYIYQKKLEHPINLDIQAYSKKQALNIGLKLINNFNQTNGANFKYLSISGHNTEIEKDFFYLTEQELYQISLEKHHETLENIFDFNFNNDYPLIHKENKNERNKN